MARKHNHKGRNRNGNRFLSLEHWMMETEAWRSLSPATRCVYIEIAARYNGSNNGQIPLSVREAAALCNIARDTAMRALTELQHKGLIREIKAGSFNLKVRHATEWALTAHPLNGELPTKDFVRWSRSANRASNPNPYGRVVQNTPSPGIL